MKTKDEIIFHGGEFDGLKMRVSDSTMTWPIVISMEILESNGSPIVTKNIRYEIFDSNESQDGSEAWAHYAHAGTTRNEYDTFHPMFCG